jgi:hypothetical protein
MNCPIIALKPPFSITSAHTRGAGHLFLIRGVGIILVIALLTAPAPAGVRKETEKKDALHHRHRLPSLRGGLWACMSRPSLGSVNSLHFRFDFLAVIFVRFIPSRVKKKGASLGHLLKQPRGVLGEENRKKPLGNSSSKAP